MLDAIVIYLLLGCAVGLSAGLLGVGGGLIIVPVLVVAFQMQDMQSSTIMHLALGTSLASIVMTAISAVLAHQRRGAVVWHIVYGLAGGMLLGSLLGAVIADQLSSSVLQRVFALVEFVIAIYMMAGAPAVRRAMTVAIQRLELLLAGAGIGAVSALLGIGGGTLTVPYLCWRGRDIHQAVAVSAACGLPIALSGALGYLLTGLDEIHLPPLATGFIYWPAVGGIAATSLLFAPLGARLAHALPVTQLKRVFGSVLLLIAVSMFVI
ncbi:hypothetical protein Tel_07875 [Candidatus Tenderia electrophaga]|jgi:hypothetical protein|uniref:Probable membrane transporter protein n=1 Tax=Candidatus Tenderia electrophaga TaxID=1748243 RepID=A0A0S2TD48_9GAMM|nr:hypothetical protein Tel_07875 [Candidatus Tenderia electrophaga]